MKRKKTSRTNLKQITSIDNCADLVIGKRVDEKSQYYYYSFYVGKEFRTNGYEFKSTGTKSKYDAKRIAVDKWIKFRSGAVDSITPKEKEFQYFAEMYLSNRKRRIENGEITDKKGLINARNRIENSMYKFFGKDADVSTIEYKKINEYLHTHLNTVNGKTRVNYKDILKGILEFAVIEKCLSQLPIFPKISRKDSTNYPPYTKKEIELLKNDFRRRIKSTDRSDVSNNRLYLEMNDLIDFCRFAPFRPGKEVLLLQHKHIKEIVRGELIGLAITPASRKVKKNMNTAIGRPLLRDIYVNRLLKRYPNITGEEYLFFNYSEMRHDRDFDSMFQKITDVFVRVSKSLDLYKTPNGNRPMYSLRSSQLMDDKSQGLNMEEIAKNSNTSVKMLDEHYLTTYSDTEQEKLLEQLYGNDKRNPKNQH